MDRQVINQLRKLHRQQKAETERLLDDVDIDDVLENGTETQKRVIGKAYEAMHADPLLKSVDEVRKANAALDQYVTKQRLKDETFLDANDRLMAEGDPEYCRLYEATTSGRPGGSDVGA